MSKKNILYLHGFRMNKEVMKFQSRKIINSFPDHNHHFINGTYISKENPPPIIKNNFSGPFYEFCQFKYFPENKIKYYGIDKTVQSLKDIIKEKNIDGIVGFSQGTYIASILTGEIPIKFLILVCGMECKDKTYKIDTDVPSFHIIGKKDEWYEHGKQFHKLFKDAKLCEHSSGHNFPKEENIYNELKDWVNQL